MKNGYNTSRLGHVIAFMLLVAAGLFIQRGYMNEYPSHIHAWAEQDHYALSLGFINNGFDLFHPETMIYNKQFPEWWHEAYDDTVTAVDFPIHEYCIALLMKLLGTTSPWVFRLWTLLCGFLGLFFLYKVAYHITSDMTKSILVAAIALCSPVYAYYLNGFLPGIPSLSLGIIGLWFYLQYHDGGLCKHFHFCIAFLTLAMLMRTTFAIELIAIVCFELLRAFRKESSFLDKIPSLLIAVVSFSAYFFWNRHLRINHGSIFLSELLPPENWEDTKELLNDTYHKWKFHYFQRFQYHVFMLIAVLSVGFGIFKLLRKEKASSQHSLSLWWLPLIETFGCLLFSVAMMQQLPNHDYYLIDSFFLPLLIIIILALKALPKFPMVWGALSVGAVCAVMLIQVRQEQFNRRVSENYALTSYQHFQDADLLLDSLDISREAKILCLYGYAQNGPFIQMKRKGFTVMSDKDNLLESAFTWDFDYIVIENEKFKAHFKDNSILLSRLKRIGGNDHLSVCTADNNWIYQEWQQFISQ